MTPSSLRARVVRRLPEPAKVHLRQTRVQARRMDHALRRRLPGPMAAKALSEARALRDAGDACGALRLLAHALERRPNDVRLLRECAAAAYEAGAWEDVIEATGGLHAIEGDRIRAGDLRREAVALRKLRRLKDARSTLDTALERAPDDIYLWRESVRLHRAAREWHDVLVVIDRLRGLEAGLLEPAFFEHQAVALQRLGRIVSARQVVSDARRHYPGDARWAHEEIKTADRQCCWHEAFDLSSELPAEQRARDQLLQQRLRWLEQICAFGGSMVWDPGTTTLGFTSIEQLLGSTGRERLDRLIIEAAADLAEQVRPNIGDTKRIANAMTRVGRSEQAAAVLVAALSSDCHWHSYRDLRERHDVEFALAELSTDTGSKRAKDPLLAIDMSPAHQRVVVDDETVAFVSCEMRSQGLTVSVNALSDDARSLSVSANGQLLLTLPLGSPSEPDRTDFEIHRSTLETWNGLVDVLVELHVADQCSAAAFARIQIAAGDAHAPTVAATQQLNKKGSTRSIGSLDRANVKEMLDRYSDLREFFEKRLDRTLFVTYGTLLGLVREGTLLQHDDDIDVAFLSTGSTPQEVRRDTVHVVQTLAEAGFDVHVGRTIRALRHGDRHPTSVPMDIQPCWFERGKFWGYSRPINLSVDDMSPFDETEFEGVSVAVPRRPEAFLQRHYGSTWLYPDPGFRYDNRAITKAERDHSNAALLRTPDFRQIELGLGLRSALRTTSSSEQPGFGRVVSYFGQPLYPLDSFVPYG
jgi:tetratricopeptide (TPR) repeat protein